MSTIVFFFPGLFHSLCLSGMIECVREKLSSLGGTMAMSQRKNQKYRQQNNKPAKVGGGNGESDVQCCNECCNALQKPQPAPHRHFQAVATGHSTAGLGKKNTKFTPSEQRTCFRGKILGINGKCVTHVFEGTTWNWCGICFAVVKTSNYMVWIGETDRQKKIVAVERRE